MNRRTTGIIVTLALAAAGAFALYWAQRGNSPLEAQVVAAAPPDVSGFARADGPRPFDFPTDHGPHPEYQTEWWYYTGNLDSGGRHFGYQLTFFRRALVPPERMPQRQSNWANGQVYMAHFALSDVGGRRFYANERLARGAAGLAGAEGNPYSVWLEDWHVTQTGPGSYRLFAAMPASSGQPGVTLELTLNEGKPPILQGEAGYSRKGPQEGQASYYYSLTRLEAGGTVRIGDADYPVSGLSWKDHEFSTSALAQDQVGWDWFSIQLDNNTEMMVFQIRKADGSIDPFSSGTIIRPDGSTRHLSQADFSIQVRDTWRSPHSGATYPSGWVVTVPGEDIRLEIEPHLADQELNVSYAYWEGAVRIAGQWAGQAVSGNGYVEMTGYSGSMGGEF